MSRKLTQNERDAIGIHLAKKAQQIKGMIVSVEQIEAFTNAEHLTESARSNMTKVIEDQMRVAEGLQTLALMIARYEVTIETPIEIPEIF